MVTLVLATKNRHKVEEIQAILGSQFRCLALSDFPNPPTPGETQATFEGNAIQKATEIKQWLLATQKSTLPASIDEVFVLADDSGLEVDALGGAPGVHSARYAALDSGAVGNAPDHQNNAKLLKLLQGVPPSKRKARFRCVLALLPLSENQNEARTFSGSCEGMISTDPSGAGGFGYDPLFVPTGHAQSFGELGPELKNQLSHRNAALGQLRSFFRA